MRDELTVKDIQLITELAKGLAQPHAGYNVGLLPTETPARVKRIYGIMGAHNLGHCVDLMWRDGLLPYTGADPIPLKDPVAKGAPGDSDAVVVDHPKKTLGRPSLPLTERELTSLSMLASGMQHKDVATLFGVSIDQAKHYARQARRKLGASNTAQAVHLATKQDLLS